MLCKSFEIQHVELRLPSESTTHEHRNQASPCSAELEFILTFPKRRFELIPSKHSRTINVIRITPNSLEV